ncbi:hypothetical protein POM88_001218 [Heracleum sosnowskyi]|uniref:Uncharacterized protein n=1 Tax=Heracleum sosnowskyi TaxID=360622 RepID=A0AAD8NBJ1_9APIA|nr:hypothetical protein POM88_001218 [Heracleum sosnowskyi]
MARMLSLKSDHHWSEACYDQTSEFIKSVLPEDNTFLDSFYKTKKHMEGLGLPSVKIDCCVNGCMIYWGEDIDMDSCKFCSQSRIGKNVWLSWIEEWKTPECMAKTEIKRNNRKGGADVNEYPATHTGGSSSARKTAALLADDYTRDPFSPELFLYTHTKNHDMKTFIDEKSAKIYEKIKALRDERSRPVDGSSTPQPVDENQLYYDAVAADEGYGEFVSKDV